MSDPQADQRAQRTFRISNASGLHARPCHALVSTALEYDCDVRIRCEGREANGKSILELMTLNAACGAELEISTEGPGAEELMSKLAALVESGFEEHLQGGS